MKVVRNTNKTIEMRDRDNDDKLTYKIYVDHQKQITNMSSTQVGAYSEKLETKTLQNMLKNLLKRRSDRNLLEKKGILRNEPIFGNTLMSLHNSNAANPVPEFVTKVIALIELQKNITSEHLYRISGNLAVIQKIRFNIDRNNLQILDEYQNDPDVLTGALKLFFRELKEPLINLKTFEVLRRFSKTAGKWSLFLILVQNVARFFWQHNFSRSLSVCPSYSSCTSSGLTISTSFSSVSSFFS